MAFQPTGNKKEVIKKRSDYKYNKQNNTEREQLQMSRLNEKLKILMLLKFIDEISMKLGPYEEKIRHGCVCETCNDDNARDKRR